MNLLFIGDIIGKPGRKTLYSKLDYLIDSFNIEFVIANAENASGGVGLTAKTATELFNNTKIDVLTTGNHIWKNKDIIPLLKQDSTILRPLNFPEFVPGKGFTIIEKNNKKICVVNLLGRINLAYIDCPFQTINKFLPEIRAKTNIIIVDFHSETTSEKNAMGWFLDGKVSSVLGTHTHIQTADERILPEGTAYITDVGMTGSINSVIGIKKEIIIQFFLTRMPLKFKLATDMLQLQGVVVNINEETGKAISIKRIQENV